MLRCVVLCYDVVWCVVVLCGVVWKIGIKCSSRFLLVAQGRRPAKFHIHGPIRRRISEEDRKNVFKIFLNFTYLHKMQPGQEMLQLFLTF